MKFFVIILLLIPLFLPLFPEDQDVKNHQIIFYLKSDLENTQFEGNSKNLIHIYLEIIHLLNELNENDNPPEDQNKMKMEISSLLKKVTELESDQNSKEYFLTLAKDIINNDFTSSYSSWIGLKKKEVDFIIQFYEKQNKYEAFILWYQQNLTEKANQYLTVIDEMKANTITRYTSPLPSIEISHQFAVADLLSTTGLKRYVIVHPPEASDLNDNLKKIIIFRNVLRHSFNHILKPVSINVLNPSLTKYVHFKSYFTNLVMHKIAHLLGPFFIQSKSEEAILVNRKLKDLFNCIEEIKADTVSICNVSVLKEKKLIPQTEEKRIYTTYVTRLIDKIRSESESMMKKPYLIQLNFLLRNEGLIFNLDTDVLSIDFEKSKKLLKQLMGIVVNLELSGRYNNAKQFINEYSGIPSELKRILKKNENIPLAMVIK